MEPLNNHHCKHKTTPFLFEAGRPGAPTQISIVLVRARACAWTGIYKCSECACVLHGIVPKVEYSQGQHLYTCCYGSTVAMAPE